MDNLKAAGYIDPKGSAEELHEQAERLGLPTTFTEEKITEGWVDKPKGSMQILFERGWLNPEALKLYTADGKKDDASIDFSLDPTGSKFSINRLMQFQSDFVNEVTLLQFHAKKLGVKIDRTPKCHPELAGEGIEYLWALAEFFYRQSPIEDKRTKEKFKRLVYKSTDCSSVLSISGARACSKKACSYMKLYKAFEDLPLSDDDKINNEKHSILEKTIKLYSKMKKKCKSHRSVADMNVADVREIQKIISQSNQQNDVFGSKSRVDVKKEVVSFLLKKMDQM